MAGGPGSPTNSESASICADGLRSAEGFMARVCLLCILFAFLIVLPAWALDTSINDVVSNPASLDGKVISLNGKVVGLQGRVSAKGNAYYTFELSDGTRSVRIFSFGSTSCKSGDDATVEGQFVQTKRVGRNTFHNEFAVSRVTCR